MEHKPKLHTKYGTACFINKGKGYYFISSSKEGNRGKALHRLIYEDYYNTKIHQLCKYNFCTYKRLLWKNTQKEQFVITDSADFMLNSGFFAQEYCISDLIALILQVKNLCMHFSAYCIQKTIKRFVVI